MSRQVAISDELRHVAPDLCSALQPVWRAETAEERERIYRFRYTVYVDELGRKLPFTDHAARVVHDPEDDKPYTQLYFIEDEAGNIVGTARSRHWTPGAVVEKVLHAFSMERFPGIDLLHTCEFGRLMIRPDLRGQSGFASLVVAGYQTAQEHGTDIAFGQCATGLFRHYRKLGFRTYAGRMIPTPDGIEVPIVMFMSDVDHLEREGSFLLPLALLKYGDADTRRLSLEPYSHLLSSDRGPVQSDHELVWDRISALVGAAETRPGFLAGLSDATARRFADDGFVISVPAGQLLTEKGLAQQEIFVLLDGTCDVFDGDRQLRTIGPGDVVGEVSFFSSVAHRSASVRANTDAQVLVIRRHFVDELVREDPTSAAEVLFQLARVLANRMYPATEV